MEINNNAYKNRLKMFNEKIDSFKSHSKYKWLRQYADDAIRFVSTAGYLQIKADDFIERIVKMPFNYIKDWLDDKNNLEWKEESK